MDRREVPLRDLADSGAEAIDAGVCSVCCAVRAVSRFGRDGRSQARGRVGSGGGGWTPGDGCAVGKASLEPRVPLVINSPDAMNDVELRVAQPHRAWWAPASNIPTWRVIVDFASKSIGTLTLHVIACPSDGHHRQDSLAHVQGRHASTMSRGIGRGLQVRLPHRDQSQY